MKKITLFFSLVLFLVMLPVMAFAELPANGATGYLYNAETGKFLSHGVTSVSNDGAMVDDYGIPLEISNEGTASEFSGYTYLRFRMGDFYNTTKGNTDDGRFLRVLANGLDCGGKSYHKWAAIETSDGILLRCIYKPSQVAYATQGYFVAIDGDGKLVLVDGEANAARWQWKSASEQIAIVDAAENARAAAIGAKGGLTVASVAELKTAFDGMTAEDKTSSITNPTMYSNTDGWTVNNIQGTAINNGSYQIQNAAGTQATVSQQITGLTPGFYEVDVQAFYRAVNRSRCVTFAENGYRFSNAYVQANDNKVLIKDWYEISNSDHSKPTSRGDIKNEFNEGTKYTNTVYTWVDGNGVLDLSIVVPSYSDGDYPNWICFNNVRLTYFSSEDLSVYEAQLQAVVSAAQALVLPATQKGILDGVIDTYNKSWSTVAEYETAIAAVGDAKTAAEAFVSPYAEYNALRACITDRLLAQTESYDDEVGATSTYNTTAAALDEDVEAAATVSDINNAKTALWAAAMTWMKSVSVKGNGLDLTWMIVNNDFSNTNYKEAWTEELESSTTVGVTNGVMRYYNSSFNLYQTLPYLLPAGRYAMTMDGFERTNDPMNTAYSDYVAGTSTVTGTMYFGENGKTVINLFDVQSITDNSLGGAQPDGASFYMPNGSSAANNYLAAGLYPNTLNVIMNTDGDGIRVGYRCANTKAWTCVDNFKLYYKGSETTVSATLGTNGYTTFACPYPLDLENLPDGVEAYEAYAVSATKVNFRTIEQAVPANTGILLKGTPSAEVFIPMAAEGKALEDNLFCVNVGGSVFPEEANTTYYGLIKDSDPLSFGWFIPSTVAIPSDKAYLKVTDGGARLSVSFDDEDVTAIGSVEALDAETPKEGKFLENDRIVIVKNGVRYGVGGQKLNR